MWPAAFALLAAAGCGGAVRVTVVNDSAARADSLVVLGQYARRACAPLAPGESLRVEIPDAGEDVIALRGRTGGRRIVQGPGAYVQDGARVRIRIDAAGIAHASVVAPGR